MTPPSHKRSHGESAGQGTNNSGRSGDNCHTSQENNSQFFAFRCPHCEENSSSTFPMAIEEDTRNFPSHIRRSWLEHGLDFLSQQGSGAVPNATRNEYLFSQRNVLEDFSQASHSLYEQACYKLLQLPTSAVVSNFMRRLPEPKILASMGLKALHDVLIGCLPTSDIEIYAAIHVAYTCALCTTPEYIGIIHEELFNNGMELIQAVENHEKFPLAAVIQQIWGPKPKNSRVEPQENDVISGAEETARLDKANGSPFPPPWLYDATYCTSPRVYTQNNRGIHYSLQNGRVMRVFKQFLDSVEYATMLNRSQSPYLHPIGSQSHIPLDTDLTKEVSLIRKRVIQPLWYLVIQPLEHPRKAYDYFVLHNDDDVGALLQIVLDYDKLLDREIISSLYELELKLLHDARIRSRCPVLYDTFVKGVLKLCDQTSYTLNQSPLLRERSHQQAVRNALLILDPRHEIHILDLETPKQRGTNNKSAPRGVSENSSNTPSRTSSGTSNSTILSSITRPSSIETMSDNSQRENVSKESALTKDVVTSTSPPNLPKRGGRRMKEAQSLCTTCPAPTPSSSSISTSPSVRCPNCNEPFAGSTRYAKQNLSRHQRTTCKRALSKSKKPTCSYENCKQAFTRKDNLKTHLKKHKETSANPRA